MMNLPSNLPSHSDHLTSFYRFGRRCTSGYDQQRLIHHLVRGSGGLQMRALMISIPGCFPLHEYINTRVTWLL